MSTVQLDEATHWYDERGQGPPLVFIHGGWSNADAWREQVEYFADDFRVITYDVRGHGRTGESDVDRYSVDLFVDDLDRLLDELDVEQPFICGLSLGSMVVQEFLDRYPDRAAGAIVAGAVRSMPPVELEPWMKPRVSMLSTLNLSLATMGSKATFVSFLNGIQLMTGSRWLSIEPTVRKQAIDSAGEIPTDEFRKIFMALYEFEPPELSDVTTPVRVVHGEHEARLVRRQGRQLAEMVDNGTHTVVEDAAHLVNQDAPESFNVVVETFVRGLSEEWAASVANTK
ncbi:alpha/beta fold hydrolase [Haloarchaeobius sp. DFWS5]|uniref:alpha/beta fold hydrolase n=1 Tax=Haloarchaeobius sp. DFWS5 TaxID=3446114 RepID=UPI003EBFA00E